MKKFFECFCSDQNLITVCNRAQNRIQMLLMRISSFKLYTFFNQAFRAFIHQFFKLFFLFYITFCLFFNCKIHQNEQKTHNPYTKNNLFIKKLHHRIEKNIFWNPNTRKSSHVSYFIIIRRCVPTSDIRQNFLFFTMTRKTIWLNSQRS